MDACGSAHAPAPVPPSPVSPWRNAAFRASSKRSLWSPLPCCRFTPIELARTAPWLLNSALRSPLRRRLLRPRLTSPRSSGAVAAALLRIAPAFARAGRRSAEISQGKTLLLRSGPAGFTCARVRVIFGRPRPLPGCPTAPAFYPVPVRQVRAWPPASSPPRLAATQLPSARGSHHQGPQRTPTSSINAMPGTQKGPRDVARGPFWCSS